MSGMFSMRCISDCTLTEYYCIALYDTIKGVTVFVRRCTVGKKVLGIYDCMSRGVKDNYEYRWMGKATTRKSKGATGCAGVYSGDDLPELAQGERQQRNALTKSSIVRG